ncbi:MAG TPA: membrane protein insertase YidC [Puia sp.]|nr:membrane protein insertase YidC [Puia sp.]
MGMDRNTIIGFVLLGLLLFVYLFTATKNNQLLERQRLREADSLAAVKKVQEALHVVQDSVKVKVASGDSLTGFNKAIGGTEKLVVVENELLKIVFSNKGGQPKEVTLKHYKLYDSSLVQVVDSSLANRLNYPINTGTNQTQQISDLYFNDAKIERAADGTQTISYTLPTPGGLSVEHQYILHPDSYLVDWNLTSTGVNQLFSQNNLNLEWHSEMKKTQVYVYYEKRLTNVCFSTDNEFDYISSKPEKSFEKPVQWVSVVQQFFNRTLILKTNFTGGSIHWVREVSDTSTMLGTADVQLQAKLPGNASTLNFQWYFGPNDYYILKKAGPNMDRIVDLGRDMYSFVRPINTYIIMPVFNFFNKFVSSYGIVILLLTLFIRLLTSPLVYSSYLSGAKMKALRPEIEILKKKTNGDQQQMGVEQMKLFREAGVNPLGGCIPALLQIPIFFALFSFFNSNVALRGQPFLWAHDLSIYDVVVKLGFNIPAYGDHISLFATLAVITSFLISLYGMSMTPDQSNPAMKYMPYIMPVMLLLFFNRLPAALTWYYTVSNLITLILQFVIQNYIIDHDKILAKLQANRNKPKTKPKWQERFEQMQEAQKKIQQSKGKS